MTTPAPRIGRRNTGTVFLDETVVFAAGIELQIGALQQPPVSGSYTIRIVQFTYPSGDILPRSSAEAGSAAMAWTFDVVPNCVTVGI